MVQNSRNQCFTNYFCLMIQGSGAGSVSLTNGSGFGSGSRYGSGSATLLKTFRIVVWCCVQVWWCPCTWRRPWWRSPTPSSSATVSRSTSRWVQLIIYYWYALVWRKWTWQPTLVWYLLLVVGISPSLSKYEKTYWLSRGLYSQRNFIAFSLSSCTVADIRFGALALVIRSTVWHYIQYTLSQCCGSGAGSAGSVCFWASRIRIH